MATTDAPTDLTGRLLIAMPGMGDPRFASSVVFLCSHSEDGAMGLIVNKPSRELAFRGLLEQLGIETGDHVPKVPIHFGGPVETGRGFVLHSADYDTNSSTMKIDDRFGMTATLDVLEDIAAGTGPAEVILALGYAGWGPGQLEAEIVENGWLVGEATERLVFGVEDGAKWQAALAMLGVDALVLSSEGGRA